MYPETGFGEAPLGLRWRARDLTSAELTAWTELLYAHSNPYAWRRDSPASVWVDAALAACESRQDLAPFAAAFRLGATVLGAEARL